MAQHELVTHPLVVRRLRVARVHDVTPRMRRVTLTGDQLAAFVQEGQQLPAFVTDSFDDHVKLVFAADGDVAAALPVQRGRSIDWPPSEHRLTRDYTPRRFDPAAGELDLDFVLHGDGPGAGWARAARPGDELHVVGPKSSVVLPPSVDWVLLAGDETGLPAIGRFLDERPVDVPVQVVVLIGDDSARQELAVRDGDTVRWVRAAEPGALANAVRQTEWWPGQAYAWVAGESRSLIPVRRWLRRERGLPAGHVDVTGYWHEERPAAGERPPPTAGDVLDPLPWLATRAAVRLGLLDVLTDQPVPLRDVAQRLAVAAGPLEALVAYLASVDVVRAAEGSVALGRLADELLGDDHLRDELFGTGVEAGAAEALLELGGSLRAGGSPWERVHGRTLADAAGDDAAVFADQVEDSGGLAFVGRGLVDLPAWREARRITVTGPGALHVAAAAREQEPAPDVVVTGGPVAVRVLGSAAGGTVPVVPEDETRRADLLVSARETASRTDAELVAHLAGLARHADRLLVVDVLDVTGPGAGPASAEHGLLALACTGRGIRTPDEIEALAGAAGWRTAGRSQLGWDHDVFELIRP